MVKLYHLAILYKHTDKAVTLCSATDLTSFGFFQRSSVQEFMHFTSQVVAERCQTSTRTSVKEQAYICHMYVREERICGAVISDHEYPNRVAHTLLNKMLEDFVAKVPAEKWHGDTQSLVYPELQELLVKYQNPKEADALSKIHADLDETQIILHNTIAAVLERGEKLDDLIQKSENLSMQSKAFYKTAKKTNSCCVVV